MKYTFDKTVNRINKQSVKWDEKPNALPMWVADMDFAVLPEIKTALKTRIDDDAFGYTSVPESYYDSFIGWQKRHYDVLNKREWMLFSSSIVGSFDSIFKHCFKPQDKILMFTPMYNCFFNCIANNNLTLVECPFAYKEHKYEINFDKFEVLTEQNIKAILLCNPHNPIGKILSKDDLRRVCEIAKKNNILVICDEIHCDITKPGKLYNPILKVCDDYIDNIVVLNSPGKTFNVAGLHCSYVICPNAELRGKIQSGLYKDDIGEPNFFSCFGVSAAYEYGDQYVNELNAYLFKNRKFAKDFLEKYLPKLHLTDGEATYLLWIDISEYSNNSEEFVNNLYDKTGLLVSNGAIYHENGSFIRLNIGTSLSNVKDGLERLKKFLKKGTQ